MLIKLSSFSASKIKKYYVQMDEAFQFLRQALVKDSAMKVELGLLFNKEFWGYLCSGSDSSGSSWGFTVYSKAGNYKQQKCEFIEHQGVDYDISRATAEISFFDIIIHHRSAPCGCIFYRVDACLPPEWCGKVSEIKKTQQAANKNLLVDELIKEMLIQARSWHLPYSSTNKVNLDAAH